MYVFDMYIFFHVYFQVISIHYRSQLNLLKINIERLIQKWFHSPVEVHIWLKKIDIYTVVNGCEIVLVLIELIIFYLDLKVTQSTQPNHKPQTPTQYMKM